MTKYLDKAIEKILKEKRNRAFFIAENNLKKAREDEEFAKLELEETEKTIQLAELMADEYDETKERIVLAEIKAKKKGSLKRLGLSETDILPDFECKLCGDLGVKNGKNCKCKIKILNQMLLERSGILGELEDFANSKSEKGSAAEKIIETMKTWAKNYPNVTKKMIYISGAIGVGKTFLSKCIVNELIKKQTYIFYSTAFKMNNDFLQYCKAPLDEKQNYLAPYLESEVLFIDDLGTEPILNNITLDFLYFILNERLLSDRVTIINSNLELDKLLERYGERIFSRIINKRNGLTIQFKGEDLRLKR